MIVTITHIDISRIASHLNLDAQGILKHVAFYQVVGRGYEKLVTPPVTTTRGIAYLGLLKLQDGSCIFLSKDNKCSIYPARPSSCRNFPFTFQLKNRWLYQGISVRAKEYCKGLGKGRKISEKELEKQGIKTIKELKEYENLVSKWNDLALKGQINPTPQLFIEYLLSRGFLNLSFSFL
jgi:hypothetical protein